MRVGIYVRVSTDDQRDNGYSIDSQIRMLKEHAERNNYKIMDIYNDAGHSGKNLFRPNMQRLLKDIESNKIDILLAIKVDRLTRNNLDGFWLLNYCADNDVKLELILEPYDVTTANGEMMFGMNLVFGQRERKEIGARTKRALEEMALRKVHPSKAPFGYTRVKETGNLVINPIEAEVVKEVFKRYLKGNSVRAIRNAMKEENYYSRTSKWCESIVYNILTNMIYIGTFAYGKYKRKAQDILYVENYCEPIIEKESWDIVQTMLEKNKHSNYGSHIHLFSSLGICPECKKILASTNSFKNSKTDNEKVYYHITCKNKSCSLYGKHYNADKIENKLGRILDELTRYMIDTDNEILISSNTKSKDIENIDKAIAKLREQEEKLIDLYVNSSLNVEVINSKNETIKKDILKLEQKKKLIDPYDDFKEYTTELLHKLEHKQDNIDYLFNKYAFSFSFKSLNKKAKRDLIHMTISSFDITKDKNHNIEITNIRFTNEFINKNKIEYIDYIKNLLNHNYGIKYSEAIDENKLKTLSKDNYIYSTLKLDNNEYTEKEYNKYIKLVEDKFFTRGITSCPLIKDNNIIDNLVLIPKN